jgi:hypothetical protein
MRAIALLLVVVCGSARASQDNRASYNDWLAATGFSGVLVLDEIHYTQDTTFAMLQFASTASATITQALWQDLRDEAGATFELRLLHHFAETIQAPWDAVTLRVVDRTGCWTLTIKLTSEGLLQQEQHGCGSNILTSFIHFAPPLPEGIAWGGGSTSVFGAFEGSADALMNACEGYLRDRFARGRLRVQRPVPHVLLLNTDGFKNEVLDGRNRWEKLEVVLVTSDKNQLVLTLDAWFAPGVGMTPPPADSYRDLENPYAGELESYAGDLLTRLLRLGQGQ